MTNSCSSVSLPQGRLLFSSKHKLCTCLETTLSEIALGKHLYIYLRGQLYGATLSSVLKICQRKKMNWYKDTLTRRYIDEKLTAQKTAIKDN